MPTRTGPPTVAGRWSRLPDREGNATRRTTARTEALLERHGVLTRGAVMAEQVPGGFSAVYPVLRAFEENNRARRGYFVETLGAAQFGTPGSIDRLRTFASPDRVPGGAVVLAATDPANVYGAALPWPERAGTGDPDAVDVGEGTPTGRKTSGHRAGRKAGALVILVDGELVLYVERGGKTLLSWTDEAGPLQSAADALALAVREGALGKITVEKADGGAVLGSDHPLAAALAEAGFHATPRGLRLRR
jgi:ATP-dependent Lhr-like helicase